MTGEIRVRGNNVSFTPGRLAGVYSFDMPVELGASFQLMTTLDAFVQSRTSDGADGASANTAFLLAAKGAPLPHAACDSAGAARLARSELACNEEQKSPL